MQIHIKIYCDRFERYATYVKSKSMNNVMRLIEEIYIP